MIYKVNIFIWTIEFFLSFFYKRKRVIVMLDLNTIEIINLASEYAKDKTTFMIIGVGVILLGCFLGLVLEDIIYVSYDIRKLLPIISSFLIICGFALLANIRVNFCKVAVKVVPNEKLTIEQIKTSDKFTEKDGEFFYVKTLKASILTPEDFLFDNFDVRINQIEKEFNSYAYSEWIKDKIINK